MATTATPYGFKPLNHVGGTPYAGAVRHIKIASGFGTNIFNGSIVNIVAAGTISVVTDIGSNGDPFPAGVIGVFVGCTYTDPTSKNKTFSNHWPTGTVASDAMAYVVDDPGVLFMAQADATVAQAGLGANASLTAVQSTSTGDTTSGVSNTALDATTAQTATIAFRIVDFVESTDSTVGDAFTDVIVKFNAGQHSYENSTGI
tara:strand:+ start:506 stop:1111 length:606 start_codon:yes stop_codon:yes gene_type:complete